MEYSSPLAAMQPQPCPMWGSRKDVPISRSMYWGYQTYGPNNNFDFKTMSMHQKPAQRTDYFTVRPQRGSSPTSGLCYDLDANFHIDKSPQAPTPRRSLFTTDLFRPREDGHLMTPPMEVEAVTTPPIPSSSPCFDAMDISPLPHKIPHLTTKVTLPSPSPEGTPMLSEEIPDEDLNHQRRCMVEEAAPAPPTFLQLPERRRPVTRPSLSRNKAHSTNYVPQRPTSAETQLPAFRFGDAATHGLSCSSTPSLVESFTESPVDELRPSSAQPMPASSVRRPSLGGMGRATGSPVTGHVRKPSGGRPAFVRPQRKIMRRSLSMFQHPDDVMQEEQDTFEPQQSLAAVMDVDQEHRPALPHFIPADKHDGLPRISQDTMADVLNGHYNSKYDRVLVIDCRFEYEYNGGHIQDAVNFNDKSLLANQLFHSQPSGSTLLIFHCEYSVHRAPMTAAFIRSRDREVNADHYPRLTYPELYVLEGGYSQFFAQHRSKCVPQSYVEMNDQRHEQACERGMAKVKQRQKLFRNQTFAFGDGHDDMDNSPTAMGRNNMGPRSQSTFNVGCDITQGMRESLSRRMASY